MNTVFKFYLHTWVLLAVAASFGTWYVLDVVRPRLPRLPRMPRVAMPSRLAVSLPIPRLRLGPALIGAFGLVAAGLILSAMVYPLVATPKRVQDRFRNDGAVQPRTDDGLAYTVGAQFNDQGGVINLADDYAAILWMRREIEGSPAIIEGVTPNYRWGSRFAINTGLPAVSAWDFHQKQQRGPFARVVDERRREVTLFYNSPDPLEAQAIIRKHDVRYVVVGALERLYFDEVGIAKLESGLDGMLRLVFQSGETNIYEVVQGTAFVSSIP